MTIGARGSFEWRMRLYRRGGGGSSGAPVPAPPPPAPASSLFALGFDSGRYLDNSGRGQYQWSPRFGNTSPMPPSSDVTSNRDVYDRFMWKYLEPTQGNYDFTLISDLLTRAAAAGGRATVRVMIVCEFAVDSGTSNAMPDWLSSQVNTWTIAAADHPAETLVIPDWNNAFLWQRWRALHVALAAQFGSDERLGTIDIGGYGNWGEWHNYPYGDAYRANGTNGAGGRLEITDANAQECISAVVDNWTSKQFVLSWIGDMYNPTSATTSTSTRNAGLMAWAMQKSPKIGWRMDSLGANDVITANAAVVGPVTSGGMDGVFVTADSAATSLGLSGSDLPSGRWRKAQVQTEFNGGLTPGSTGNNWANALARVGDLHVCLVSNANWALGQAGIGSFSAAEQANLVAVSKAAGAKLRVKSADLPTSLTAGQPVTLTATWRNEGNAPCYFPWTVVYRISDSGGAVVKSTTSALDVRTIQPAVDTPDAVSLDTTGLANGTYTVSVRVVNSLSYGAPMEMLNTFAQQSDGGYPLANIGIGIATPAQPQEPVTQQFTLPAAASLPAQPTNPGYYEITVATPTAQTNYPLSFGAVFEQGMFPASANVTIDGTAFASMQVNVRNRWPDNSIKFAQFACVIPSIDTTLKTIRFTPHASGNLIVGDTSYPDYTALMSTTFPTFESVISINAAGGGVSIGSISARTHIDSGRYRIWRNGSVVSTLVLEDHTGKAHDVVFPADGAGNSVRLRPVIYVDFWWATGEYRVRTVMENSDTTGVGTQSYDVSITKSTSYTAVYSKSSFSHTYGSRWSKTFWSGAARPNPTLKMPIGMMARSKALENYDTAITIAESAITTKLNTWTAAAKDIGDPGSWTKVMSGTGGRPDLGPHPEWIIDALYDGRSAMWDCAFGHADLAGGWPMNFRTGDTGRQFDEVAAVAGQGKPPTRDSHPTLWYFEGNGYLNKAFTAAGDKFTFSGTADQTTPPANNGWSPDTAHISDPYYIPYLVTGDAFYLDGLNFWAAWVTPFTNPNTMTTWQWSDSGCGRTPKDAIMRGQPRGDGRSGVLRARAGFINPDGSAEKAYFWRISEQQLRFLEGTRIGTTNATKSYNAIRNWWVNQAKPAQLYSASNPLHFYDAQPDPGTYYRPGDQISPTPATGYKGHAPWMYNIALHCIGMMRDMGYDAQELLSWMATCHISLTTNGYTDPWAACTFAAPLSQTSTALWQTWQDGWNGVNWANYVHSTSMSDTTHGYPNIARVAASYVFNEPGGAVNWAWFAQNINTAAPFATTTPKLAILPRAA